MKTERFTVNRDDLIIRGIAYLSEKKSPTIIMSHGFLANLGGFEYAAEYFCKLGYNVYTYNFCCGSDETNPELKSDGDSRDMCLESEIKDLIAVYNYVTLQNCVKNDEIYLYGESQGGLVSGLVAARLQEKIKKLIMIFPAVCIPDHARRGVLGGANYDPKNPPEEIVTPRAPIGKVFHDGVKDMDVYSELAKYKGETLLIQGTDDSIVVPEYQYIVKDLFDKTDDSYVPSENNNSTTKHRLKFQMVRGMDHWTGGEHKEALAEAVRFFIEGLEEIMSFRIIVTNIVSLDDNDKITNTDETNIDDANTDNNSIEHGTELTVHEQDVYFTGYCESKLFTGTISSGVDHQAYKGNECIKMQAEYTFTGVDEEGKCCDMKVINNRCGGYWKPEISVNSERLSWLNTADLSAIVEGGPLGPTIRIYK